MQMTMSVLFCFCLRSVCNMKYFIAILLFALASARKLQDNQILPRCDGVVLNGINHEKETIKEYLDKPYMMSIDYDTNVLFFTFTGNSGSVFTSSYINLKTKEYNTISGIRGGFATSVDPKTHKIYIGGADGIYEFDYEKKTATHLDITDKNIWQIYAKDGVYFTTYPNEDAFVYKNGMLNRVTGIENKAMLLGLDNDGNIFFSNSSGLYCHKKNGAETTYIGEYTVNSFTNDDSGKLYFSTPTQIFKVEDNFKITKLANINNIYGIVVESDGSIIYASQTAIIRLKSTGAKCNEIY